MGILNVATTEVAKTVEENPVNKIEQTGVNIVSDSGTLKVDENSPGAKQTLVLDGPLSTIYTKALNVVLANETKENIGTETQQMDSVMVADAHRFIEKHRQLAEIEEIGAAYVYVTDEAGIEEEGLAKTYDDLRIALDMQGFSHKAVCIELPRDKVPSKHVSMIVDFVGQQKIPLFFSREAVMTYLKG